MPDNEQLSRDYAFLIKEFRAIEKRMAAQEKLMREILKATATTASNTQPAYDRWLTSQAPYGSG